MRFIRCWNWAWGITEDFINANLIIFGGKKIDCEKLASIYSNHTKCKCKEYIFTGLIAASLIKYTSNSFLATKVTFFNELHNLFNATETKTSWEEFIYAVGKEPRVGNSHMSVPGNDGRYGYGGACFPKDTNALLAYSKSLEKQLKYLNELYNAVKKENEILLGINTLTPPSIELDPITVEDKNEFIPIPKTNTNNKATNGDSSAPKLLSKISPKYPSRALQRNLSGSVTVIFDVDKEGNTKNIRIFKSSSSLFENEAKRVVRISKYRPAIDSSGKPIDFYDLKKTYEFNLE